MKRDARAVWAAPKAAARAAAGREVGEARRSAGRTRNGVVLSAGTGRRALPSGRQGGGAAAGQRAIPSCAVRCRCEHRRELERHSSRSALIGLGLTVRRGPPDGEGRRDRRSCRQGSKLRSPRPHNAVAPMHHAGGSAEPGAAVTDPADLAIRERDDGRRLQRGVISGQRSAELVERALSAPHPTRSPIEADRRRWAPQPCVSSIRLAATLRSFRSRGRKWRRPSARHRSTRAGRHSPCPSTPRSRQRGAVGGRPHRDTRRYP
jgi:hypothetical protein